MAVVPTFHDRLNTSGRENLLRLQHLRFVLFVYRNAVAVYSEADFVNTTPDSLFQIFALPSTGHAVNREESGSEISNGILSVQLWAEGKISSSQAIHDGSGDWVTIRAGFAPGEGRKLKALFWAQTSLARVDDLPGLDTVPIPIGRRGFIVDLSHAAVWSGTIRTIDVAVVLKGGMSFQGDSCSAEPATFDLQDSTMTWSLTDVEPSATDNIAVFYAPSGNWGSAPNTMADLSAYIVGKGYDSLKRYVQQLERE